MKSNWLLFKKQRLKFHTKNELMLMKFVVYVREEESKDEESKVEESKNEETKYEESKDEESKGGHIRNDQHYVRNRASANLK